MSQKVRSYLSEDLTITLFSSESSDIDDLCLLISIPVKLNNRSTSDEVGFISEKRLNIYAIKVNLISKSFHIFCYICSKYSFYLYSNGHMILYDKNRFTVISIFSSLVINGIFSFIFFVNSSCNI